MSRLTIADVMTTDVVSVGENALYKEIVDVLTGRRVSAVPVLDVVGHVVGVVSQADLLHKVELTGQPGNGYLFEGARQRTAREKAMAATARELMSVPAVTAMARTSIVEGARLMDSAQVKRLPVVDDLGRLVGIVSRGDLLKVFLQPDPAIAERVVADVLRGVVQTGPPEVTVEVRDAVVTLTGQVPHRSQIPVAVGLTAAVDGVVDVVNRLTYRHDDTEIPYIQVA
jgi:CBS-domain-containing membrane protein